MASLRDIYKELLGISEDVASAMARDPAARTVAEVALLYPGVHALISHRLTHQLWLHGRQFQARALSQWARWFTGVEIHPGATIGRRVFIDHGMGVVIGETAEVGNDVTLYHGVTLGGTSLQKQKRHPTVESHVVIGAGAKILGPVTIGHHSRIGSGSVVVTDIPAHCTVVGVPGRVVARYGEHQTPPEQLLDHANLPDPIAHALDNLHKRIDRLAMLLDVEEIKTAQDAPVKSH